MINIFNLFNPTYPFDFYLKSTTTATPTISTSIDGFDCSTDGGQTVSTLPLVAFNPGSLVGYTSQTTNSAYLAGVTICQQGIVPQQSP